MTYRMRRNCLEYIYRFVWKIGEKTDKTPFGVFAISAAALIYFRASAAALKGGKSRGRRLRAVALITDVVRAATLILEFKHLAEGRGAHFYWNEGRDANMYFIY